MRHHRPHQTFQVAISNHGSEVRSADGSSFGLLLNMVCKQFRKIARGWQSGIWKHSCSHYDVLRNIDRNRFVFSKTPPYIPEVRAQLLNSRA